MFSSILLSSIIESDLLSIKSLDETPSSSLINAIFLDQDKNKNTCIKNAAPLLFKSTLYRIGQHNMIIMTSTIPTAILIAHTSFAKKLLCLEFFSLILPDL